jgi:hypothetical protein
VTRAVILAVLLVASAASAQPGPPAREPSKPPPGWKPPIIDMDAMPIGGRLRAPQMLYFLERAHEELGRASLERRSFIPEMVRTLDEGML